MAQVHDETKEGDELVSYEIGRFRALHGYLGFLQRVVFCAIPVLGIAFAVGIHRFFGWLVFSEQYIGVFLTLILVALYMSTPMGQKSPRDRIPWYDVILVLLSMPVGLFITMQYPEIVRSMASLPPERIAMAAVAILLVLEGLRRTLGWMLVIVALVFIAYGRFADLLPGNFKGLATSWERLAVYLYIDPNSMLSYMALTAGMILAFIFFGQVLVYFGGAQHLTHLALAGFGRFRGGPAKASVVSSSLVGMITGGPTVNIMITGTVTIPLMIRSGYKRDMAGAIESIASSGAQIMPPVMGSAAFLIAEAVGIPYAGVALAAFIPAVLFYFAVFVQVDLEADMLGARALAKSEIPKAGPVFRNGWVVLPCLAVLVYTLFVTGLPPATAGIISGFVSIPLLMLVKSGRGQYARRVLHIFEGVGKVLMPLTVLLAAAGFIEGVTAVTGLGFNLSYALLTVGQNNLFLLLVLAAACSFVLGTGLPTVGAYALVAALIAPALVQLGVSPLAAHLFIFYFAIVSNWTPPVAAACMISAAIAGGDADRTGWIATRLGILAYIVPFVFVYSPALMLMDSNPLVTAASIGTAVFGTFLLGVGLVGYLRRPVRRIPRLLFLVASVALLIPVGANADLALFINIAGLALAILVLVSEWGRGRAVTAAAADAASH